MLEGMAESIGMMAVGVGMVLYAYRKEIRAELERRKRRAPRHVPAVAAVPEYQGRHRFDETKPWEARVFDEDKKEVGRVRSEGGKDGRLRLISRRDAGAPAGAEHGTRRTPGPVRAPAGPARQRFARPSARSEKLMALR